MSQVQGQAESQVAVPCSAVRGSGVEVVRLGSVSGVFSASGALASSGVLVLWVFGDALICSGWVGLDWVVGGGVC